MWRATDLQYLLHRWEWNSKHATKLCKERWITFGWGKTYSKKSVTDFMKLGW